MKKLPVEMNRNTFFRGLGLLFFQQLVLPSLLSNVLLLVNPGTTVAEMNFAFFLINYLSCLLIFWKFISAEADVALQNVGRVLLAALVGYFAYNMMMNLASVLIFSLDPNFANLNDAFIGEMTQNQFAMIAVGTVLLVPPAEELLFRGVLFNHLYHKKPVLACILSVCLFSLVHLVGYIGQYTPLQFGLAFLQYVPAGISLCFAYIYSGTIFAPILLHTLVNAIGMISMYALR